jgi:hypothetical protein
VNDESTEVLREILAELKRQGAVLDRAAGFLDNPVARYKEAMRRSRRDGRDTRDSRDDAHVPV